MGMNDLDAQTLAVAVATAVVAAQPPKQDIPAPLKWAAVILSGIAISSVTGMGVWLVSTVADVQLTVTRMDERSVQQVELQAVRDEDVKRRLEALERQGG
jgi:hypothetical protein